MNEPRPFPPHPRPDPRLGLVLGSGSARGWSHIGVIRTLEEAGIAPDIVCGTSIGALVGAAYAADELDRLEDWVRHLTWQSVVGLLDLTLGSGLISGAKLLESFRSRVGERDLASLPKRYAAVATELATGREIWLREGPLSEAVRASIALPGLFTPMERDGRQLVDGGLVNPVPVSLCRALGADVVIAVDLNWDLLGRHHPAAVDAGTRAPANASPFPGALGTWLASLPRGRTAPDAETAAASPSMLDVLTTSINIMQVRITRSRLAGDPADVLIRPRLSGIAAMDYHRGAAAIAEGRRAARQALAEIEELTGRPLPEPRSTGG